MIILKSMSMNNKSVREMFDQEFETQLYNARAQYESPAFPYEKIHASLFAVEVQSIIDDMSDYVQQREAAFAVTRYTRSGKETHDAIIARVKHNMENLQSCLE